MTAEDIERRYRSYIDCLNRRDWAALDGYVTAEVVHNGQEFGVAGYRAMLEQDVAAIPDLTFVIETLVASASHIAARLGFDCHPAGTFLGLAVNGRRVQFTEHVFYRCEQGNIAEVWSLLDKAAIESQLAAR